MSDEEPGLGGGDCAFEVLCEATAASEPGEGALNDPAPRQKLDPLGTFGPFDDFQHEGAKRSKWVLEPTPAIAPAKAFMTA